MADYFEEAAKFREEAQSKGLVLPWDAEGPRHYFDVNQGQLNTEKDLQKVWDLVKLARDYADGDSYGEHKALLQLVAGESELEMGMVYWHRAYHVDARENPEKWKSLRSLLEENGFDMGEVYRDGE